MKTYRMTVTNGTDRTYNISGDSIAELIVELKQKADWTSWKRSLEHFGYTDQQIAEEFESGFYYTGI